MSQSPLPYQPTAGCTVLQSIPSDSSASRITITAATRPRPPARTARVRRASARGGGQKGPVRHPSVGGTVPIHSIFGRIRPSSALGNETTLGTSQRDFLSIRFGRRLAVSRSSVSEAGFGV